MLNTEMMIREFQDRWGDHFDYSQTVYTRGSKISIMCRKHGPFVIVKPSHHLRKTLGGCSQCWWERRAHNNRARMKSTEEFIAECIVVHGKTYDYGITIYHGAHRRIEIICSVHGPFWQLAEDHITGHGCKRCVAVAFSERRWGQNEFIANAVRVHGDRFDYTSTDYQGSHSKIAIICNLHGTRFYQKAYCHIAGQNGCADCNNRSGACDRWLTSLSRPNMIREYKIEGTKLVADAYDPDTHTLYQFHGDYWHGNPKRFASLIIHKQSGKTFGELYDRTLENEEKLRTKGYRLITMWEHDWKNVVNMQRNQIATI
jgi:hypothetical protein